MESQTPWLSSDNKGDHSQKIFYCSIGWKSVKYIIPTIKIIQRRNPKIQKFIIKNR